MIKKFFSVLISAPRTIWFNFRYLPISQAIKLPIWLAPNVRIKNMYRGGMILESPRFNSSHIGFHIADAVDCYGTHTIICIEKGGKWHINADLHIGRGAIIHVKPEGCLKVGSNFAISGTTSIICSDKITIGHDVQFSWNTLVMDSDAHKIYDVEGKLMNPPSPIDIGDKVWVAANTTILKKGSVGNNCVIGGNSLVNRPIEGSGLIIAGIPAKAIKKISSWEK